MPNDFMLITSPSDPALHQVLVQQLTPFWEEALQTSVKPDDNFFSLGGNSIKAVRIMNQLQQAHQAIFHPTSIFDAPTINSLATYCLQNYPEVFCPNQQDNVEEKLTEAQITTAAQQLRLRNAAANIQVDTQGNKNSPTIFLLSPPRSGSTLLRVVLGGNSQLFSPPELYLLSFNSLQQRAEHFSGRLAFFREGLVRALMTLKDCDDRDAESLMQQLEQQNLSSKACFALLQDWLGERRLVDKTPSYALNPTVLQRAEAEFDNALFIHLVRHPLAMIHSYEEIRADLVTQHNPADELPYSARQKGELWWHISHQNILDFLQTVPRERQIQIRYEDFVSEPESHIRQLCSFLDLPFTADMLDPYQDTQQRMSDGIHQQATVMGDQKFHQHQAIDTHSMERWREKYHHDFLSEASWNLAEQLGYNREVFEEEEDEEREEWEI